jgi:tetratricopeptide (TPR) repeat protein
MSSRFDSDIKAALKASARYCRDGNIQDLNEAIKIWEQILSHPDFVHEDRESRLMVLNWNAGDHLLRYQAEGEFKDLEKAITYSTTAVVAALPDSPNISKYINKLGIGLINIYFKTDNPSDLEQCISAFQRSVYFARADNLPELPIYLNNLGNSLMCRYAKHSNISDVEEAVSSYDEAINLTGRSDPNSPNLSIYLNGLKFAQKILSDHKPRT